MEIKEKEWDSLTIQEQTQIVYILKTYLINNWLVSRSISIKNLNNYLSKVKQKVIFHFVDGKETVLSLNKPFIVALTNEIQIKLFKETGSIFHKDYLIEIPKIHSLDEIFKSNN